MDGFYRVAGYKIAGYQNVPVIVRHGTWQEARDFATSANTKHLARKRTIADKERAIRMTLEDHPDWSDNLVAKHTKTSATFVGEFRPEVKKAAETTVRVGQDGKKRPAPVPRKPRSESGQPTKREMRTFDWDRFDTYFRFIKTGVDACESLTSDKAGAKKAHAGLNGAFNIFAKWRKTLEKKE